MGEYKNDHSDCVIAADTIVESGVIFGQRVMVIGPGVVIRSRARLDAASVITPGVTIGQGAWIKPGAVVTNSVPPNAIIEGNPGEIVGYRSSMKSSDSQLADPVLIDVKNFQDIEKPAQIPLEVGGSVLYLMRRVTDVRGSLTVGEVPTEVPFIPKRYFLCFDVPSVELRGEHAHKYCQQFLICAHGSCRILLDDGDRRCELTLDRPDVGVFMPELIWGTQYRYSADAVLLVFASRPYEADDYLRTYEEFLEERERRIA